ncbi:MAG: DUF2191 domain-containing protein [Candidatus Omnitrophica bacterium]|nr:hypothetical protein [bacterium]NUN97931.1 DUF2191 domain-containing protein [Candidatus Omnitrophota bacterium]
MRRATITLPSDLLEALSSVVEAKSKTEAVLIAIRDEIRRKKLARIQTLAGRLEFGPSAEELRHSDERLG